MEVKFLKAHNGDAILLRYNDGDIIRNILIDGGTASTYSSKKRNRLQHNSLFKAIESIKNKNEKIDLLILTHVDDDHIGGLKKWFESDTAVLDFISKVWFNSGRTIKTHFETNVEDDYDNSLELDIVDSTDTSIGQGVKFEDFLKSKPDVWGEEIIKAGKNMSLIGLEFNILSPNEDNLKALLGKWEKEEPESIDTAGHGNDYKKSLAQHIQSDEFIEDTSIHNGSSISFNINHEGKNYLFLGDSFPTVVESSLKELGYSEQSPLHCELVKISHHGSKANNSVELLKLIDSSKYIISTNGKRHAHPNKQMLARLINQNPDCEIYFNYSEQIGEIFSDEDRVTFQEFQTIGLNEDYNCY